MAASFRLAAMFLIACAVCAPAWGQETDAASGEPAATTVEPAPAADESTSSTTTEPATTASGGEAAAVEADAVDSVDKVIVRVDQNPQAQQASAGVLKPIYMVAERLSFPAFHWLAFAVMVAGVVSFALQLVLGKLVVLTRMSLSVTEILSDALGLAVSLIGLVLTTQAAAENSNFTTSAFAVLSATAAGVVAGFLFYLWGQRQELQAAAGRRVAARRDVPPTAPRG